MNREEFSKFYLAYKTMAFNICYSYLRNVSDAEDATLDTFMKVYGVRNKFESSEHAKNYLIRVAINTSKDYLRRKRSLPLKEEVIGNDDKVEIDTHFVWEVVNNLPNKQKDVIYLRYILDLLYKDIANILKISEETARKRHELAIKKLRVLSGGNNE